MFELNSSKLLNLDAFDLLDSLEDSSVDLLFLDPPYECWEKFCKKGIIDQAKRVVREDGNVLCFTNQSFDFQLRNTVNPIFRREIIWAFSNGGAWVSNNLPLVSCQKIYHLVLSKNSFFNPRTGQEYLSATKDHKRKTKVWEGYKLDGKHFKKHPEGTWLRDVLYFNKPTNTGRTCCKPSGLIEILIKCFCKPRGRVVDPFAGSGVVMQSTLNQSKEYLGSEIDANAINFAKESIVKKFSQLTLPL